MNLGHISTKHQEDNYKILNEVSAAAEIENLPLRREESPFLQILTSNRKESFDPLSSQFDTLKNATKAQLNQETAWKPLSSGSDDPYSFEARQAANTSYGNNYSSYEPIGKSADNSTLSNDIANDYPGYKSSDSNNEIVDSEDWNASLENEKVDENSDSESFTTQDKSESTKNTIGASDKEINEESAMEVQGGNTDISWMSMILNSLGIKNSGSESSQKQTTSDSEIKIETSKLDSESQKKSNANLEKNSQEEKLATNKEVSNELKSFEKKILTSSDLMEKIQRSKEMISSKSKSEKNDVDSKDSIALQSKEILSQDLDEKTNSSKIKQDKNAQSNPNSIIKNENLTENSDKNVSDGKSSQARNILTNEKDNKNIADRPERLEFTKEVNKWDIQKEKNIQSEKSSANTNNLKDGLESITNSQTSSKGDGNRDDSNFQQKSDFMKTMLSKKADESNPLAERFSKDEIKENMNRLVEKAKIQIISQGKSQAEIRMNPQDLGRMILKINVNQDKVEGRILVDSEAVKAALQSDMSGLKEELRNQGLNLLSLSIDVDLGSQADFGGNKEAMKFGEEWIRKSNEEKIELYEPNARYVDPNSLLDIVA
ncbi:flagellar hook-length control protein FliK [Leptospira sp. GIMC2001]|uniref:flagellar hook-length control protein FliK n=1 Tax=Leptospira sp. GIMC2001 TaxID=1513297 RepID=UPI0004A5C5E2|nr:flagellar hook-length control protein FliK [Leptospira sp. GIMC2001]AID56212.1 flagellar hook-length control protein FliK [Leptospira sp. GIMC2001]WCL50485.1 flagellar hook-length control protein FliK [Leptospira sp. GIMC2001]